MDGKFVGIKYSSSLDVAEIAKMIRQDLKAAIAKGELPKIKTSVKISRFAGGKSIDVTVKDVPKGFLIYNWDYLAEKQKNPHGPCPYHWHSEEAAEVLDKIKGIMRTYLRSDIDSMTDYYNVSFWDHQDFDSDLTDREYQRFEEAA